MKVLKGIILILLVVTIGFQCSNVYATTIDEMMGGASNFINAANKENHIGFSSDGIKNTSDLIYNTLLVIGIIIAVGMGVILGIKFMTSAPTEQAKIKESLIIYAVGCVVIFGSFGIWKLVTNTLTEVETAKPVTPDTSGQDAGSRGYNMAQNWIKENIKNGVGYYYSNKTAIENEIARITEELNKKHGEGMADFSSEVYNLKKYYEEHFTGNEDKEVEGKNDISEWKKSLGTSITTKKIEEKMSEIKEEYERSYSRGYYNYAAYYAAQYDELVNYKAESRSETAVENAKKWVNENITGTTMEDLRKIENKISATGQKLDECKRSNGDKVSIAEIEAELAYYESVRDQIKNGK